MLVDSHCHLDHLNLKPFDGSLPTAMANFAKAGVDHLLCVSITLEAWPLMVAQLAPYEQVSFSVGVHPCYGESRPPSLQELASLAEHPRVVAIGETGLDRYHADGEDEMARQHERFRLQIQAARQLKLPLIIHSRAAGPETLQVLRAEGADEVGGVMHCFDYDWQLARAALDLNFYLSFSGIVTYKRSEELRQVAAKAPLDRILVETDSPYLAPLPHRGRPNQPDWVRYVAERVADVRSLPLEQLAAATTDNFFRLFARARRP